MHWDPDDLWIVPVKGLFYSEGLDLWLGIGQVLPFKHRQRITAQTNKHSQWTMDGDFWYYKPKEVIFLCKLIISGICYSNEKLSNTLLLLQLCVQCFPLRLEEGSH